MPPPIPAASLIPCRTDEAPLPDPLPTTAPSPVPLPSCLVTGFDLKSPLIPFTALLVHFSNAPPGLVHEAIALPTPLKVRPPNVFPLVLIDELGSNRWVADCASAASGEINTITITRIDGINVRARFILLCPQYTVSCQIFLNVF
jgi:hypothetical protein